MTLYELTGEYQDLLEQLEFAETDDDVAAIMTTMEQVDDDLKAKAEAYAKIMQNLRAEVQALRDEEARLAKRRRRREGIINSLGERMRDALTTLGVRKLETGIGTWSLRKSPPSCKVLNPALVPEQYHVKQEDTINRMAIIANYRLTGEIPDGTDIIEGESIQLR